MKYSEKCSSEAIIKLKRINIPLDMILKMVYNNRNRKKSHDTVFCNKKPKKNFDKFGPATDDEDYDSADDILDPKTEIELVNTDHVDQDETMQNIFENNANTNPKTYQIQIENGTELFTTLSQSTLIHNSPSDNMLNRMRSQFQAGTSLAPAKHKCLMPGASEITIASEYCTAERPCVMNLDKLSLHYVIHYIKRGVWNKVVPEPVEEDKPRIDGYQCNICDKKFRNNHSKEEYPARGSFICHFATEHGKIIDAMRNDAEVDMKPVIEILEKNVERLGKFVRDGTATVHDNAPVKVVESITWRIQQDGFNIYNPSSQRQKKHVKTVIKCPKCKDFDKNKDPNNLKLHIFHHYLDFWEDKVVKLAKKETVCDQCSPLKRIVGANPEGCRTALICHRAIQHGELRTVLENDPELPEGFIEELFGEVAAKPVKVMHAGTSKNKPDEDIDKAKAEHDMQEERERIAQEVRKREMMSIFEKRKKEDKIKEKKGGKRKRKDETKQEKEDRHERIKNKMLELQKRLEENTEIEEQANEDKSDRLQMLKKFRIQKACKNPITNENSENGEPYVRKRIKQNLKNLSFYDDSDEDGEWSKPPSSKNSTPDLSRKVLPRRQVAPTKLIISDESDIDWDD